MSILKKIVGISLLSLGVSVSALGQSTDCQTIRLAETGWADISATTSVVSIIAEGLGYKVNAPIISVPIAFTGISTGKIDAFLGYWSPSMDSIAAPFIKKRTIYVPEKANLEGAKYTLAVPVYTYEAGLKSYNDIAKFKKELHAEIYGIEAGNDGNILLQKMIKDDLYGLKDFKLKESSEAAMLSQVKRAVKKKQPIVFLAWEPHPMNSQIALKYLSGGEDVFGPNYGEAKVFTIISPKFKQRCSVEAGLIEGIQFTVAMENEIMADILENRLKPKEAAKQWLKKHPEVLQQWLSGIKSLDGQEGKIAVEKYLNQ